LNRYNTISYQFLKGLLMPPLAKGKSKKTMEKNFHELKEAHPEMPNKQRTAIVLNQARRSGAKKNKTKK
jgi:hypothetical protein